MREIGIFVLSYFFFFSLLSAQEANFKSIHQEESELYHKFNSYTPSQFDSLNGFSIKNIINSKEYQLTKKVFGYFPYWAGNNYLNYQWDLLSDLCYFSYEVDPNTGNPVTIHDWETSPAIDSAFANNVKVHLCVTIFSGHYIFFGNEEAQQTLISNIITLIQDRGAHGVNLDVELLPASLSYEFTNFVTYLDNQLSVQIPDAEVSIASPAVNWSNTFNFSVLNDHVDFFMVMGYDYYWNGSSQAGAVSPLYSLVSNYDYNFSKTISYYQSQGIPNEKIVIGVPYYARQWPTTGQYAPSATIGNGTAYTYRYIQNNSASVYTKENKHFESNSFSPYYSFQNNGWYQCFVDDVYSMGKKYDQVNRRNLAGIGIWALGYDDGYSELWELIADKFSENAVLPTTDTIFDTGGPAFDYYNNENYTYTFSTPESTNLYLSFSYLNTEEVYDSLWIFDGLDTTSQLIGGFSGDSVPMLIVSSGNSLALQFKSDNGITNTGWRAVYDTLPISSINPETITNNLLVYPNPAYEKVVILPVFYSSLEGGPRKVIIQNSSGQIVYNTSVPLFEESISISIIGWNPGIYVISFFKNGILHGTEKLIVK